ncbi:MAG: hypothetical protein DRG31_05740 [Deltaproteobacteria bacterium]|nr:MAG: hypothetical protein DRG31_05740 [Deltaproteobacteria bacterium]
MRIGIDAHIILPKHKRYDPKIARYTEQLILNLLDADKDKKHTWVLFFDDRMKKTKKFERDNVEIKHFPFVHYRKYLPVVYSHMMISAFLAAARLDVFHSPEGLIPFVYTGKKVTTFHYVPKGKSESNLFVRTFMLGARKAFAGLCGRANVIIVNKRSDKVLLTKVHKVKPERVVVMETDDIERVDWSVRVKELTRLYKRVAKEKEKRKRKGREEERKKKEKKVKVARK